MPCPRTCRSYERSTCPSGRPVAGRLSALDLVAGGEDGLSQRPGLAHQQAGLSIVRGATVHVDVDARREPVDRVVAGSDADNGERGASPRLHGGEAAAGRQVDDLRGVLSVARPSGLDAPGRAHRRRGRRGAHRVDRRSNGASSTTRTHAWHRPGRAAARARSPLVRTGSVRQSGQTHAPQSVWTSTPSSRATSPRVRGQRCSRPRSSTAEAGAVSTAWSELTTWSRRGAVLMTARALPGAPLRSWRRWTTTRPGRT